MEQQVNLLDLPDHILVLVFSHFDIIDKLALKQVNNHRWCSVISLALLEHRVCAFLEISNVQEIKKFSTSELYTNDKRLRPNSTEIFFTFHGNEATLYRNIIKTIQACPNLEAFYLNVKKSWYMWGTLLAKNGRKLQHIFLSGNEAFRGFCDYMSVSNANLNIKSIVYGGLFEEEVIREPPLHNLINKCPQLHTIVNLNEVFSTKSFGIILNQISDLMLNTFKEAHEDINMLIANCTNLKTLSIVQVLTAVQIELLMKISTIETISLVSDPSNFGLLNQKLGKWAKVVWIAAPAYEQIEYNVLSNFLLKTGVSLRSLSLINCTIDSSIFEIIDMAKFCCCLQTLRIIDCNSTPLKVKSLGNIKTLKRLTLLKCTLDCSDLQFLLNSPSLTNLTIKQNQYVFSFSNLAKSWANNNPNFERVIDADICLEKFKKNDLANNSFHQKDEKYLNNLTLRYYENLYY